MKLYYFPGAPSPRKAGIVIAGKGLDIPAEILNIRARERLRRWTGAIDARAAVASLSG